MNEYLHYHDVPSLQTLFDVINGYMFHLPSLFTPVWMTNMPINPLKYNSYCTYHFL